MVSKLVAAIGRRGLVVSSSLQRTAGRPTSILLGWVTRSLTAQVANHHSTRLVAAYICHQLLVGQLVRCTVGGSLWLLTTCLRTSDLRGLGISAVRCDAVALCGHSPGCIDRMCQAACISPRSVSWQEGHSLTPVAPASPVIELQRPANLGHNFGQKRSQGTSGIYLGVYQAAPMFQSTRSFHQQTCLVLARLGHASWSSEFVKAAASVGAFVGPIIGGFLYCYEQLGLS